MASAVVEATGAGLGAKQSTGDGHDGSKPRFEVSFDALARNFGVEAIMDEGQDDKLMKSDEMLALVGGDHMLTKDQSTGSFGGSFSALFSDEASRAELQQAMLAHFSEEDGRTPPSQSRPRAAHGATPPVPLVPSTSEATGLSAQSPQPQGHSSQAHPAIAEGWIGIDRHRARASLPLTGWASGLCGFGLRSAEPRVEGSGAGGTTSSASLACTSAPFCAPTAAVALVESMTRSSGSGTSSSNGALYRGASQHRTQPRPFSTAPSTLQPECRRANGEPAASWGDLARDSAHELGDGAVRICAGEDAAAANTGTVGSFATHSSADVPALGVEPSIAPTHAAPRGPGRIASRAAGLAPASALPMPSSCSSSLSP